VPQCALIGQLWSIFGNSGIALARKGVLLTGIGVMVGLVGALILTRLMTSLLFGVISASSSSTVISKDSSPLCYFGNQAQACGSAEKSVSCLSSLVPTSIK
jgi:hypothetical protein